MTSKMIPLPPVLRPRLTWRYFLGASVVLYVSYCFLFDSPFFASKLPRHNGAYAVGTIDVEMPVQQKTVSSFKLKATGEPAFKLDTVLFSLYYPADLVGKSKPWHYWIPKPISITAEGYASFGRINNFITNGILAGALWSVAGGLQIPVNVDMPIHQAAPQVEFQDSKLPQVSSTIGTEQGYPVLVFSHGFASSRTDYTHYLGELASRGYIVAAIEHRDGSGPASLVMKNGYSDRVVLPFRESDMEVLSNSDSEDSAFKKAQLDFRQAEIEETARVLQDLNNGRGEQVFKQNSRQEGKGFANWKGRLNMDEMTIGGHSFGATGALQALKGAPSKKLPFRGGIALDPGKSSGRLNADIDVPVLVIHSNSWSSRHGIFYGRPHFDVVKELVQGIVDKGKGGWFLTSIGTSHPSVTDAPLIEPLLLSWTTGARIDAHEGVREYVKASEQFLRFQHTGKKTGLLAQPVSHPRYKDTEGADGVLDDEYQRYWQVHVTPPVV